MKVEFLNVVADNFRSFKHFGVDLSQSGIAIVQGELLGDLESVESNGAGKSSLFSAISWALYGKLPHISGKDVTGDDVVFWNDPKNCFVKVRFKIGGINYKVVRYRLDKNFGNKIRVWINNDEKTLATNPQTQKLIDEYVGIPLDLFAQLVYITDSSMKSSFSFETDANRKKILVDVLPHLKQFSQARDRVKGAHDVFNNNHKRLKNDLDTLHQMMATLPDMTESQVQIVKIGKRSSELQTQIKSLNFKVTEAENSILDCIRLLKEHEESLKKCNDNVSRAKVKYDMAFENLSQKMSQRKMIEKDYIKWLNARDDCPECNQKIKEELKELNRVHYKAQLEIDMTRESEARRASLDAEEALRNAEHEKNVIVLSSNRITQEKKSFEQDRERLQESVTQLKIEKENLSKIHDHLLQECQTADAKRELIQFRIEETERLLETVVAYIDPLKFWMQGFGPKGVISLALHQTLDLLSERTNHWLHQLWHEGASIKVGFPQEDISKITVDFLINGKIVNITSLSSGQTRRLCLALCFGLRETLQSLSGWQTNLLVLDEVFDGLDNAGRLQVLEKIREIKETSIFVISQFPHSTGPIDRVINVQFDHGVSKIL